MYYYYVMNEGPLGVGTVWRVDPAKSEPTRLATQDEINGIDGETSYRIDANSREELINTLGVYGFDSSGIDTVDYQYAKARSAVTAEFEPLLTAKKDTRVAMVMREIRNDVALEELGNKYYDTAREMKAAFRQIDNDLGVVAGEPSIPQPTPQAACFFCAEPMRLISVLGRDWWECPVCGRRVPVGEALSFVINTDLAAEFNATIKKHLDDFARLNGYDNIDMAISMINSAAFAADGQTAMSAYDVTWQYIINNSLSGQVAAGTLAIADAIAQLPALSWDAAA